MANNLFIPQVGSIQPQQNVGGGAALPKGDNGAFDRVLRDRIAGEGSKAGANAEAPAALKFSAHALSRLKDRSISMGSEMMQKLEKAVDTAAQKGSKESLILTDDAAFIVSVKNKTVITVVDRNQMNGNVFTNIDSTVVV